MPGSRTAEAEKQVSRFCSTKQRQCRKSLRNCKVSTVFCNKCDFPVAHAVMSTSFHWPSDANASQKAIFFIVGTNDGTDIKDFVGQLWYNREKAAVFGWEIVPLLFNSATALLADHPEVQIFHRGISNAPGVVNVVGEALEGVGDDHFNRGDHGKVSLESWSNFTREHGIWRVSYALIDVEGNEGRVLQGMDLEHLAEVFPVFQYEQSRGVWSLTDIAKYLDALGYSIFLMGVKREKQNASTPVLLQIYPEFYEVFSCKGMTLGGNVLAVLRRAMEENQVLAGAVKRMLWTNVYNDSAT